MMAEDRRLGSKKRAHSLELKVKTIEEAERSSKKNASEVYRVPRTCVIDWCRQEAEIREEFAKQLKSAKRCRLSGGGRPVAMADLEDQLYEWYEIEYGEKGVPVSRKRFTDKAKQIYATMIDGGELAPNDFKFSKGWLDKFLQRRGIVQRRTTSVCQRPPEDYEEKLISFVLFVSRKIQSCGFSSNKIFACDETAVWLDPPRRTTLAPRGSRDVPVKSLGHTKLKITVMLTAKANGNKCLPYVLLNRKRPVPEITKKYQGKLVINWAGKTWMNDQTTKDYLQKILGNQLFGRRFLLWDSFRCHISKDTKTVLKALKVDTAIIPGGCTKYIQPADVSWNKPFKEKVQDMHDDWLSTGDLPVTRNGNPAPPPPTVYLDWVVEAWKAISSDLIKNSFKTCAIGINDDGSEDHLIHAFKDDGPCPGGIRLLQRERVGDEEFRPLSEEEEQVYDSDQESEPEQDEDDS